MNYLLDTNSWIALAHHQDPGIFENIDRRAPNEILLCSVVLAELWYGAERGDPAYQVKNKQLIAGLAAQYISLPFDDNAARDYAKIRAYLFRIGLPIGPNDTLIAAIARSRGFTLVTHNIAEFSRVPGLLIEDWQTS